MIAKDTTIYTRQNYVDVKKTIGNEYDLKNDTMAYVIGRIYLLYFITYPTCI